MAGLTFSSIKLYDSSRFQAFMMADFNSGKYNTPYEVYAEKLDDNYPNISLTALPIKFLKARYFLETDSLDQAKKLLFESIKANPYIKGPETLLSQLYFKEEKYDSALAYSKDAFYTLPDVNAHRHSYFNVLNHLKDSTELENAFEMVKDFSNSEHWYEYFVTRYQIVGKNDAKVLSRIEEFKQKFPDEASEKIIDMENFVTLGGLDYTNSYLIAKQARNEFANKNYSKSIELYESAILLNDTEYTFYENAGIAYSLIKDFENAVIKYDEVIYRHKSTNGKSEYLKGLVRLQQNQKENGCKYLKISAEKKYVDKNSNVNAVILYNSFCVETNNE
jgi:tetratricopeptide (TPR) repeat protein